MQARAFLSGVVVRSKQFVMVRFLASVRVPHGAWAASSSLAVLTRMSMRTAVVRDDTLTTRCYASRGTQLFINNERFEIRCTIAILFSKESPCYHDYIPS